jgi:hypothetical protein
MQGVMRPVAQGPLVSGQTTHAKDRTQTYHITCTEQTLGPEGHLFFSIHPTA